MAVCFAFQQNPKHKQRKQNTQQKIPRDWNLPPNETFYKGDIALFIGVEKLQLSIYYNAIDSG